VRRAAEEHRELHRHERGEEQVEGGDRQAPLERAQPPAAGPLHAAQVGRPGQQEGGAEQGQRAGREEDDPAPDGVVVHVGHDRVERPRERGVRGREQGPEHEHQQRRHRDGQAHADLRAAEPARAAGRPRHGAQARQRPGEGSRRQAAQAPTAGRGQRAGPGRGEQAEHDQPAGRAQGAGTEQDERGDRPAQPHRVGSPPGPPPGLPGPPPGGGRHAGGPDRAGHRPADAGPVERQADRRRQTGDQGTADHRPVGAAGRPRPAEVELGRRAGRRGRRLWTGLLCRRSGLRLPPLLRRFGCGHGEDAISHPRSKPARTVKDRCRSPIRHLRVRI
jgi:hypothetical protein